MNKKELFTIIYTITILLSVMYATQPLQPLLAQEFKITIIEASSFTAVIMLFLAIAPIFYGYVLEKTNAKKVIIIASILLFITNVLLSFSDTYEMFLFIRTIEAIIIPAILTACMSLLASDTQNTKLNMSIYVASTVFGGLVGRIMSGYIATEFGWRVVFLSLSFALLIGLYLMKNITHDAESKTTKVKINDITQILKDKRFFLIYLMMFCVFFVFAGLLNILPFKVKEIMPDVSETQIGFLYLGYGMGIIVSLYIHRIVNIFKKELRAILFGIVIFSLSTIMFLFTHPIFMFSMVFLFCVGMFIIHTLATRIANSLKASQKALTSGMYLAFYYIGGTLGSIIPPYIYLHYGWEKTIWLFFIILSLIFAMVYKNMKIFKDFT